MPSGGWNKGIHSKSPMDGKKHTPEALEKMRMAKLGKPGNHTTAHSEESIALMKQNRSGIPAWNKGVKMPESFCKRLSEVQIGKIIPVEQRIKISQSMKLYEFTPEHKKNISVALINREISDVTRAKLVESHIGGFWLGNIRYDPQYCEIWKDVNPRVHAFFNYRCVECGKKEDGRSHVGHHVFYVKKACCWYNEDGIYYTNLNAKDHHEHDYCIGENPNYFVILCPTCHGKTGGGFINRLDWANHFKKLIDEQYSGKCYFTKDEFKELKKKRG